MNQKPGVWRIGNVTITRVVEIETRDLPPHLLFQGLEPVQVRKIGWLQPHFADASGMLYSSIPSFIVESEGKKIIVDTCVGNDKTRHYPPFNHRQGAFLTLLAEAGFPAESIDTVVCTHLHVDHVGWNTRLVGNRWIPTFPNARYLFGRLEWEYWHQRFLSGETANTDSAKILDVPHVIKDSVLPIVEADVHTFVEMDHQLTSEVSLLATLGHTPGHVSISIHSNGQKAIITGDIFHHPIEMEYPELLGNFDVDLKAAEKARIEFLKAYSGSDVLILGTHFPSPTAGRIVQNGKTWLFDTRRIYV
jgi:glyoxylase-like metal-dependent hydrolase (beta-lactamase superfamily II)